MAQLISIIDFLDGLLRTKEFTDDSLNGLQVQASENNIRTVAVAVDAGQSVIEKAIAAEANLIIVHHGLMWGTEQPIRGSFGRKVEHLLKNRCSLYCSHLPLDGHLEVGNAAELARFFKLQEIKSWFEYKGNHIGVRANLSKSVSISYFTEAAQQMTGGITPLLLPFGKREISKVGIVTGSGAFAIDQAAQDGLELLISGEAKQSCYHHCRELGINALFLGHYATETFGVLALARTLKEKFEVITVFIDEPTGI